MVTQQKHTEILEGYGVRLRPVTVDDAEFILETRNGSLASGNIPKIDISVEQEQAWLKNNIINTNDYFYIIESYSGKSLGTIGVYGIDFEKAVAEEGRLVIQPGSLSMVPAFILLFDFAFNTLKLERLTSWCVPTNKRMIDFKYESGCIEQEKTDNQICFVYPKENYLLHRDMLMKVAIASEKFQVK